MSTTTFAQGSNPGLTNTMQIFYDRVFLERAKYELRHDFGADVKDIPMNSGWARIVLPLLAVMR